MNVNENINGTISLKEAKEYFRSKVYGFVVYGLERDVEKEGELMTLPHMLELLLRDDLWE